MSSGHLIHYTTSLSLSGVFHSGVEGEPTGECVLYGVGAGTLTQFSHSKRLPLS